MIHTDYCATHSDQPCNCGAAEATEVEKLKKRCHNVFGTSEGRYVLGKLLTLGGFGQTLDPNNQAQIGMYNFAISIADMSGAFDIVYQQLGMKQKEG
jgi:hypothetical protein